MEMEMITQITRLLPLLIPLAVIQLGLMIAALIHVLKHDTYKTGNRTLWVILCVCVNIIGPILYFTIGRSDD